MRLIREIYAAKAAAGLPVISFEFFPPKTEEGEHNLLEKTIPALVAAQPDYCSVTYGAGGSTREKTLTIVDRIQKRHGLPAMAHLTCVSATRTQIAELLAQIRSMSVRNILALRGDPPAGGEFAPQAEGFAYASELVEFVHEQGHDLCVAVAGFPEGHIACREGKKVDWGYLKRKIDAGADFVISQFFFDNSDFFEFRDHLVKELGVQVPLIPGVIPILRTSQIKRFTELSGARIPKPLAARLELLGENEEAVTEFGIEYASRQCEELLRGGVPGIHFYTLNRSESTVRILQNLGRCGTVESKQGE